MSQILRVIDIETTGMEPPAEIIELGWQDVRRTAGGTWVLDEDATHSLLFSCERPCPPEVMAVHHILPSQIAAQPRFNAGFAREAMDRIGEPMTSQDVYVAHNAKFEMAFLGAGLTPTGDSLSPRWGCTYKAALRAWPGAPDHKNQTLLYWLGLHNELDEDRRHPPHRAQPDAYVSAHILCRLLNSGAVGVEEFIAWSAEPPVMPTCPIGKFRGKAWPDVEAGFLTWMLAQASMEDDLKWNARRELDRRRAA